MRPSSSTRPSTISRTASRVGDERPPDVEQVVPELRDAPAGLLGRPLVDVLLQLVDLLVDVVEQVEVPLGDLVDEVVRDHPRGQLAAMDVAELLDAAGVERLLGARSLADGDDPVAGENEIDLLVEDAVFFRQGNGHEGQAEDVVAVALDGGPQVALRRSRAAGAPAARRHECRPERASAARPRQGRVGRSRLSPPSGEGTPRLG